MISLAEQMRWPRKPTASSSLVTDTTTTTLAGHSKPPTGVSRKRTVVRNSGSTRRSSTMDTCCREHSARKVVASLLVVAFALISQLTSSTTAASDRWTDHNQTLARLDQLVAIGGISLEQPTTAAAPPQLEKLDYIMEFMRTNKLLKFYQLIKRPEPEVGQVRGQLNQLDHFTLFVPTDEAMGQLAHTAAMTGPEAARFLLGHTAGQLIAQRPDVMPIPEANVDTLESLAGSPLRLATQAPPTNETSRPSVQLSINGANILSGQSYALQEQNNQSATYAIVHLLDRPIYPQPELNLRDLLRRWAPRMANYFALADLEPVLVSGRPFSTLLAPTDDAFRSTPAKLMRQLDTNRTLLVSFLRGHLLQGLHFGQQLVGGDGDSPTANTNGKSRPRSWTTDAGSEVEFEVNKLRSRSLLLANSVPVLEADLLASNGVLHLLARPLFEAQILSECQCSAASTQPATTTPSGAHLRLDSAGSNELAGSELERDESGPPRSETTPRLERERERERLPRSGSSLVERNNRDFYRPSTASMPANIRQHQQVSSPLQAAATSLKQQQQQQLLFDEDRYQVLNATIRREQQVRLRDSQQQAANPLRFAYDRLLPDTTTQLLNNKRPSVLPANEQQLANINNNNNYTSADQLSSSPTDRQQRLLLKFQAQDARPTRTSSSESPLSGSLFADQQQQSSGKTASPASGAAGCAFYDSECKRLSGRLVRLPETRLRSTTPSPTLLQQHHHHQTPVAHLDSTFGEQAGELAPTRNPPTPAPALHSNHRLLHHSTRISSPLEQPLPPWTMEDERAIGPLNQRGAWRTFERDINRIRAPKQTADAHPQAAPVWGAHFAPGLSRLSEWHNATTTPLHSAPAKSAPTGPEAAIFVSPTPIASMRGQFFRPTLFATSQTQLYQVTPPTTAAYPYHAYNTLANNITNVEPTFVPVPAKRAPLRLDQQFPVAPVAHRRHRLQQILMETNGSLGANFDASAEKQARKLVQLSQPIPVHQQQQQLLMNLNEPPAKGDISVTSARLMTQEPAALLLATQASNQALNVSQRAPTGSDFFQDRTIAEIMDDSGLRIDGQQVTFSKLKECLAEANMLSLVRQDSNQLTIFMPTDLAFQRLVQQQLQLLSQQQQDTSRDRNKLSSRLMDPNSSQMLPLVVRRRFSGPLEPVVAADASLERGAAALDALQDRVTLDCGSHQVRQLLLDHLSAKLISPKQLQKDLSIVSLGGRQLLLSSVPSRKIVVVDGQPVVAATRAQNGMVYVLNKWLNLTQQKPNVLQLLETQPNLTTFLSYLTFSGLDERLRKEIGPITLLAPTNEAFEQLSKNARQLINNPLALMDILRGHILEGAQYGKLISMRNQLKTLNQDQVIEAKIIKPNVYLLDNQMTSMRLIGTTGNGVVNSIDKLIIPSWLQANMSATPKPMPVVFDSSRLVVSPTITTTTTGGAVTNLPLINRQAAQFERPIAQTGQLITSGNSFLLSEARPAVVQQQQQQPIQVKFPAGLKRDSADLQPLTGGGGVDGQSTGQQTSAGRNLQLIEKLGALMQASQFIRYMQRSRVPLKPDMNYVILVPTDQAIEKLPRQIIDMLERDLDRLDDLVNYHVLDTTFEYINTIPDGTSLNTINEKEILFNWHRNNSILTASGAVVMGGIQEDNIALLIVDRVLYPTPGNILQIISKSPILSNFTDIIKANRLEQQLTSAGPYTLFAPSDIAFNQLQPRDLEFLRTNRDTARRFLMRHLSQPTVFTASIALSQQQPTLNSTINLQQQQQQQLQQPTMFITNSLGEELTLRQKNDYFSVNDVNFSYADVAATNGVVHVIDGLL